VQPDCPGRAARTDYRVPSVNSCSTRQTVEESLTYEETRMNASTRPWSPTELDLIDRAPELQIASRRPDGSIRSFVTVWMVRVGTDVYVRSGAGYGGVSRWLPRARDAGGGMVRVADQEWAMVFAALDPADPTHADIDGAYVHKYHGSFGMTDPATHEHTLRLTPAVEPPTPL